MAASSRPQIPSGAIFFHSSCIYFLPPPLVTWEQGWESRRPAVTQALRGFKRSATCPPSAASCQVAAWHWRPSFIIHLGEEWKGSGQRRWNHEDGRGVFVCGVTGSEREVVERWTRGGRGYSLEERDGGRRQTGGATEVPDGQDAAAYHTEGYQHPKRSQ